VLTIACNNFTATKPWPRRIRWAGHVARMRKNRTVYRVWRENMKKRKHLQKVGINGRIILKWKLTT
jgi:hypothetical protein